MHYISLGYFCSIAMDLEKLGLRTESSPFDWLISDFEGVIRALLDDPEGFSIEGFEEYYSLQEREMLSEVQERLLRSRKQI